MTTYTTTRTEWAIRTTLSDGSVAYSLSHTPGWGTRFQDAPIPYTEETARYDIESTTQFKSDSKPTLVSREVVEVVTEWTEGVTAMDHERWVNIDWTDNGGIRGYDIEHCRCATPWRHRP